ncbi:MAG: hypothetical protein KA118_20095 [Verrucomicrobia bacterium]|nr:hypothetical protein [Verrucomicrobiota bacterium]
MNCELALLMVAGLAIAAPIGQAARVYYTDQPTGAPGSVVSLAPDGSDQQLVITVAGTPDLRGIAWHRASGRVFVLDNGPAKRIFSIRPDGTGLEGVVGLGASVLNADLEIDEVSGKLYWADANPGSSGNGFVFRANLDGSGVEPVVTTPPGTAAAPYFLFLDPPDGFIYWGVTSSGNGPSSFRRATFTGALDPDFIITTPTRTRDLAVDPATRAVYWCDRQSGTLFKGAVAGGVHEVVLSGLNAPHGLALDAEAGKLYWADTGGRGSGPFSTSARRIARCNLDGTEFENLSMPAAQSEPWDLALDVSSPSYEEWQMRFFSATSPQAEPAGDADGDGAPNLLEYALATHPRRGSDVPLLTIDGAALRFTRRLDAKLSYCVEVSTDLAAWHFNGDDTALVWTTEEPPSPLGSGLESARVLAGPALSSVSPLFFRVRIAAEL